MKIMLWWRDSAGRHGTPRPRCYSAKSKRGTQVAITLITAAVCADDSAASPLARTSA